MTDRKEIAVSASSPPDPIDLHVGARIRMRRKRVGMTLQRLADDLDLSFQQVLKYELGLNRVSASKLYAISQSLKVPVSYFFEGLPGERPETDEKPH